MIVALWVLALLQGGAPRATAGVDRTKLTVGDLLTLTIRVRTSGSDAVVFQPPSLAGFAIVKTSEVTNVSVAETTGAVRTTTRRMTLRAERPGATVIGPVRVRQGIAEVATHAIAVTIDRAVGPEAALSPRARALVQRAPPPVRNDQVSMAILVPADTVTVGEQLDVVVAAWFPRDLRLRLRGQPRITLPVPIGGWAYPEERPDTPVASDPVRGRAMDLYVVHSVVFPLEAGRLMIPPASVEYGVPVSFSIFSREERYALHTDSLPIAVLAPPVTGRPSGEEIVQGSGFTLSLAVATPDIRVGEPVTVSATLRGVGNAALWPAPALRWPTGFRAYPAETDVSLEPEDGLVAGTKTFSYLVVSDSAGAFVLPEIRYAFYDVAARRYGIARTAPQSVTVLAGVEPHASRALPPLLPSGGDSWPGFVADWLGPWGWVAIAAGPPLVVLLAFARRRRAGPAVPTPAARALSRLGMLERQFQTLLASHVPNLTTRDGDSLGRALRAAGIERAVADHVMRLRDRLRAARYGPRGVGDGAELAAELEQVLRALGAERGDGGGRRRRRLLAVIGCAALFVVRGVEAQRLDAEALYRAGALRAASDSFAARAAADPGDPAHWYNLGATLYRAGEDGKAVAAWTLAARLAPRNGTIERARRSIPEPDQASEELLAVGPVTPTEWAIATALCWISLWAAILSRRRRPVTLLLASLTVVSAWCGTAEWRGRRRPVAVVIGAATPVQVAPYGSASAGASLDAGAAVLVVRRYGRWLEVARPDGIHGWVQRSAVVPL